MGAELLKNTNFNSNYTNWHIWATYAENTTDYVTTGGMNNTGCIKMNITRTNDPGMCTISQPVVIQTGKQYLLSFWAARSGTIDIWAAIKINGTFTHMASAIPQLATQPHVFKQVRYIINVPSQSQATTTATIMLIAGSAIGTAWFDDVSFTMQGGEENPSIVTYQNCKVEQTTRLYESPDIGSTNTNTVYSGSRLNLYECDENSFIRCKYSDKFFYVKRACVNTADSDKVSTRNASNMFGSTTLKYAYPASEQAKVYNLQWTLNRLGYNCGTVDGKFGQGTESAVRSFQKACGIDVDGKVGANTKANLITKLNELDS